MMKMCTVWPACEDRTLLVWICKIQNLFPLVRWWDRDRQNIPCCCPILWQVRISQQVFHEILYNQKLNWYLGTIRPLTSSYVVFMFTKKLPLIFLRRTNRDPLNRQKMSTERCHITQNTNLIIPKINKLHSGEFFRHRLQFWVSLSEMLGGKTPWICSFRKPVRHKQNCYSDIFHLYNAYGALHSWRHVLHRPFLAFIHVSIFDFAGWVQTEPRPKRTQFHRLCNTQELWRTYRVYRI
jgi:hypothetical protein